MSEHDKAGQARKGLIDTIKGRAKEIVGAVTGNDSLTAEGQLDQVQAQQRKEANASKPSPMLRRRRLARKQRRPGSKAPRNAVR